MVYSINMCTVFLFSLFVFTHISFAKTAQDRRNELEIISQLIIEEPDPLQRIANFENLLKTGKTTDIDHAIKLALRVNDTLIRSLAIRAYFHFHKSFTINADFSGINEMWEDSDKGHYAKIALSKKFGQLMLIVNDATRGRMLFQLHSKSLDSNSYNIFSMNNVTKKKKTFSGKGAYKGESIDFQFRSSFKPQGICSFKLKLEKQFELVGSGICTGNYETTPPFSIKMNMY